MWKVSQSGVFFRPKFHHLLYIPAAPSVGITRMASLVAVNALTSVNWSQDL